ncbi:hypothetical protein QQ020_29705 [Fulvivirgaceae bacterium BMA12]|uniref:Uncharacterized protein n=1 Tax=Agaribacillus aureus TaxID=3051825 RepID=A0ABT8LGY6_9BACT|nr:hypothetical protein [Fulvivirgaceae bacterium BMA12]
MEIRQGEIQPGIPPWMRGILLLASVYGLVWGLFIYNFPDAFFQWITESGKDSPTLIEYAGISNLLFSLLCFVSALYPKKYWYLIIIGLLSKIIDPIWFYFEIMNQQANKKFLFYVLMNDIAWVIPLGIITFRESQIKKRTS